MFLSTYIKTNAKKKNARITQFEDKVIGTQKAAAIGCPVPIRYHILKNAGELRNVKLPEKCVIKYNNLSSSSGVFLKNGDTYKTKSGTLNNLEAVIKRLESRKNVSSRAPQYEKDIKQKLIVEELLEPSEGKVLWDIKAFCVKGKVQYIRMANLSNRKNAYCYTPKYKRARIDKRDYPLNKEMSKPKYFDQVVHWANKLASKYWPRDFLRIDFYSTNRGAVFGEFTFHPNGGRSFTQEADLKLGMMLLSR